MALAYSDEQEMLRASIAGIIERRAPLARLRQRAEGSDCAADASLWNALADEAGIFRLAVPEQYGGDGFGFADTAVIFEEAGRALLRGPAMSTLTFILSVVASADLPRCRQILEQVAGGKEAASVAFSDVDAGAALVLDVTAAPKVSGTLSAVRDGSSARWLLTAATAPDGPTLVVVDLRQEAVVRHRRSSMDLSLAISEVSLLGAGALVISDRGSAAVQRAQAVTATCASLEMVGALDAAFDMANQYGKDRFQFGRPIGSFQAVKHRLASMLVERELSRAAALGAVEAAETAGFELAASVAKGLVSETATGIAMDMISVFGGIGYTWEHDAHLFFRRLHSQSVMGGSRDYHRRRVLKILVDDAPSDASSDDLGEPEGEMELGVRQLFDEIADHVDANGVHASALSESRYDDLDRKRAQQAAMHDRGLVGFGWPTEFGGQPADRVKEAAVAKVAVRYHLPVKTFGVGVGLVGPLLIAMGTREQMAIHLRRTLRGEEMWCQLFSEPGAGSDLAGLRTMAREDRGGWRITGQKVWTTGAHVADYGLLLARTDPSLPKHAGITAFILDMKQPGIVVRPLRQMTGHSEFNEVFIDGAFVSHDDVIGGVGHGWEAVRITLGNERRNIGTSGAVRSPATSPSSLLRTALDPEVAAPQPLLEEIAALHARQSAIELLGRLRKEQPAEDRGLASIGKLATARQTKESAELALRMLGVRAVAWDPGEAGSDRWAYSLLTSPLSSIAGGTDDIQRNVLGERALGLPREPGSSSKTPFNEIQFGV